MFRFRQVFRAFALALILIMGIGIVIAQSEPADATVLQFDIAEIPSRYVFNESQADENGMPTFGRAIHHTGLHLS